MGSYPQPLSDVLETFEMFSDPSERAQLLLSFSDQFKPVPPEVATKPYPKSHQIPQLSLIHI